MSISILLAEDDVNPGFVISDQFKSEGYDVTLSTNGVEALVHFHERKFHLCIFL